MFPSSFSSSPSRLLYFQLTPSSLKFDMLPKLLTSSRAIFVYNYGISLRDFFNYHQLLWTISMQTWSFMMVNESWNYHRLSSTIMTDWTGLKRMWTLRVKIFLTGVHIDEFSVSGLEQLLQSSFFTLKWGSENFVFNKIQPTACEDFAETRNSRCDM